MKQLGIPYGVPQDGANLTPQWKGWFNQVKDAANEFIRGRFFQVVKVTADYTMEEVDCAILADATAGNIQITLVAASLARAKRMMVKKLDASANTVTVLGTFDGAANLVLGAQYQSFDLVPDLDANVWWLA